MHFFRQSLKSHVHSGNTKSGRQMKAKHFLNQQYFVFIFWLNFNLHRKLSHFLCCLSIWNCVTDWVRKKAIGLKILWAFDSNARRICRSVLAYMFVIQPNIMSSNYWIYWHQLMAVIGFSFRCDSDSLEGFLLSNSPIASADNKVAVWHIAVSLWMEKYIAHRKKSPPM